MAWKNSCIFRSKVEPSGNSDLIIEVGNVSEQEYDDLRHIWLGFENRHSKISTSYGDILLDEELKGNVYVNGLYIECSSSFQYGYNFKPEYLILERDRKSCDSWSAKKLTATMVSEAMVNGGLEMETVHFMIEEDTDAITNIDYSYDDENKEKVTDMLKDAFDQQNEESIPVNTQSDYSMVKEFGGNPVFVPYRVGAMLTEVKKERITRLLDSVKQQAVTPKEKLQCWYDQYHRQLSFDASESVNYSAIELPSFRQKTPRGISWLLLIPTYAGDILGDDCDHPTP